MAYNDWIPLDETIFEKLDSCDPSFAWELMKNDVIQQLLGDGPIPVPFLDEALSMQNNGMLRNVGTLMDVCAPHIDISDLEVNPREITNYHIQPKICLKYSNVLNGQRKGVKITLENCKAYEVAASVRKGDLELNMEIQQFQDTDRIYIIHEIFYADSVKVSITIGESRRRGQYQEVENKRFEHKGKIPIAFCADKFPFTKLGIIGMRQKTDGKQLRYSRWKRIGATKNNRRTAARIPINDRVLP